MDEFKDDEIQRTVSGAALPRRAWALVRDGVVVVVVHTYDFMRHPFGDVDGAPSAETNHTAGPVPLEGVAVIDVTGADAHAGMFVDNKGNVTPAEGRTERLSPDQPAYHGGPAIDAPPANAAVAEAGAEHGEGDPEPNLAPEEQPHPELPPPDKPEGV